MSIRLRLILVALIGLPAALVISYWFHAAEALRKGIEDFAARQRAEGWVVEIAPPRLGGFPLAASASLDRVSLVSPQGLSWGAENLVIEVPLADPLSPRISAPGFHRLGFAGWSGMVSAKALQARARVGSDGRLNALTIEGETLALEQAGIDPAALDGLRVNLDLLHPADAGHAAASVAATLEAKGLTLPDIPGLPLDRRVRAIQIEGRLMGTPTPSIAAWSAEGGVIEIDRVVLDWPPLTLEADGTLALDSAFQPQLAGMAHARGWSETVVRLVQAGLIEPGAAEAAKLIMSILARPDAQGRPTLNISVTLQDGDLTVGQVKVARIPHLSIPGGNP